MAHQKPANDFRGRLLTWGSFVQPLNTLISTMLGGRSVDDLNGPPERPFVHSVRIKFGRRK